MQQAGLSVLLVEGKPTIGGGLRSAALTLPGYTHDICSAVHPFAACSPFLQSLPLDRHGFKAIYPTIAAAHPFDDGTAAALHHSVDETAKNFGDDATHYRELMEPLSKNWNKLLPFILNPASFPAHPLLLAKFGYHAIQPVTRFLKRHFHNSHAQGLFAGMAAHGIQPL